MALFVGIDVAKDKFDACGIDEGGKKKFFLTSTMDRKGFEKLVGQLKGKSLLLGLESTACYHMTLFSYLTSRGYRIVIINPLLIANFVKLQLRKTKTDKKDAFTIAQFLMLRKEALEHQTLPADLMELRDLARRRERLADQVTKLKGNMKRILSVIFPELEHLTGVFNKSTLRLLSQYPSADGIRKAGYQAVAGIVITRSRGMKPAASLQAVIAAAEASVGVSSPAKDHILKQEASLLLHVQEQIKETTKIMMAMCSEQMKKDAEIMTSVKGVGDMSALNFLIEIGGTVRSFQNDKKLIAAAGLDPSTYQSGKYEGASRISKRGNRHLRRLLWIMTRRVITSTPTFRTYFFKRRAEGLPYKKAVLATAHKLVRIIFALLINQRCFEEGRN